MFHRDMVCLRNISVDTLHKGDTEDDDDDDDNNNNNNNNNNTKWPKGPAKCILQYAWYFFLTEFTTIVRNEIPCTQVTNHTLWCRFANWMAYVCTDIPVITGDYPRPTSVSAQSFLLSPSGPNTALSALHNDLNRLTAYSKIWHGAVWQTGTTLHTKRRLQEQAPKKKSRCPSTVSHGVTYRKIVILIQWVILTVLD